MAGKADATANESCIVNIFGETYNLGREADTPYAYAGMKAFRQAYPRVMPALACKYFPARGRRPVVEERDMPAVLSALKGRLAQIGESALFSGYLVNAPKRRTYQAIERAILALERQGAVAMTEEGISEAVAAPAAMAAQPQSATASFTPDEQYLALINLTWHLLHPNEPWPDTLARVKEQISKNSSIAGLVENIRRADGHGDQPTVPIRPLNYFTRLESLAPIEKASTLEEAYAVAKSAAEADARKAALDAVTDNLSAIIAVLKAHGYMEKSVDAADLSGELISRIGHTFDPVIAYLRTLYDPVFLFLEKAVNDAPKPIPIGSIMGLIQQAMAAPVGVMAASQPLPELTEFMTYLAGRIDEHLAGVDESKRGQFYEMLTALPTGKGVTVSGPSKMTGIFPRSELDIKSWVAFDRVDGEGYKALIKAGVAASDMRAAYDAAVSIFNKNDLLIVSGATADFPDRITYEFSVGDKKPKLRLNNVLNRMRNYVNTAMLSMLVLIAFRAGLPGGAEVMGKNIRVAEAVAAAKETEAKAAGKAEADAAAAQSLLQKIQQASKAVSTPPEQVAQEAATSKKTVSWANQQPAVTGSKPVEQQKTSISQAKTAKMPVAPASNTAQPIVKKILRRAEQAATGKSRISQKPAGK